MVIVSCLVADRINSTIDSLHFFLSRTQALLNSLVLLPELENLLHGIAGAEIHGGGTEFFYLFQSFRDVIHYINLGSSFQNGAVGRQQTDRSSAENSNCLAGSYASKFGCMIGRGENIREEQKIIFPLVS